MLMRPACLWIIAHQRGHKKTKVASKAPGDPATAREPSTSLTSSPEAESAGSSSKPSRQRKADHNESDSDSVDENQCCVCFQTYENDMVEDTGLDWLQCACKRCGRMKSALTMTYAMMLMAMICCVHFAVFDCIVVYYFVCINSDFVT